MAETKPTVATIQPSGTGATATDLNPVFRDNKSCHLSWANITKTVELRDTSQGLLKSSIGDDVKGKDSSDAAAVAAAAAPPSNQKIILNQVSGQAQPGQILALMGPSGSGKTSLLDALSARSAYQHGTIRLNHQNITDHPSQIKKLKRRIAYIKQQDVFFNHLTVKDQLTYTAFLRLGDDYTKEQKIAEVQKVIALLRLEKCQDTPIMLVSGGEKKRVNIGTELLTNPSIIMLDEPTSGLDSTSAVALIDLLVSLAHDHGKTIITSIHQPSSAVFHKFDNVLFLADGCVVYYGTPCESLGYCKKMGYPCPDGYNGSDHWMDLLVEDSAISEKDMVQKQVEVGNGETETEALIQDGEKEESSKSSFPIKLDSTVAAVDVESGLPDISNPDSDSPSSAKGGKGIKSFFRKVSTMSIYDKSGTKMHLLDATKQKREEYRGRTIPKAVLITAWDANAFAEDMDGSVNDTWANGSEHSSLVGNDIDANIATVEEEKKFNTSWMTQFRVLLHRSLKNSRSAVWTSVNIVKALALGVLVGCLWFQMPNDETRVRDRGSLLFFSSTYWIFDGTFQAIFSFPAERSIIFKERASGSYHLSAYFLSKTLSEMPTRLILPSSFWLIVYWMSALNPRVDVFIATLCCILISVLAGESYGLLCGALVMDFEKATAIMIVISLTSMAAGGYYVQNIPVWLTWLKFISPFKFGYEASQILVFDRDVPCDGSGVLAEYCTEGVEYVSSEDVLDTLGSEGTVGMNIGILLALALIPRYLAFLALKNKRGAERS